MESKRRLYNKKLESWKVGKVLCPITFAEQSLNQFYPISSNSTISISSIQNTNSTACPHFVILAHILRFWRFWSQNLFLLRQFVDKTMIKRRMTQLPATTPLTHSFLANW